MTADDKVFAFGGLEDVDHVCHADYSRGLVENRVILDFKVLAFT